MCIQATFLVCYIFAYPLLSAFIVLQEGQHVFPSRSECSISLYHMSCLKFFLEKYTLCCGVEWWEHTIVLAVFSTQIP